MRIKINLPIIILCIAVMFSQSAFSAKPTGVLSGKILDKKDSQPIIGATVRLEGTTMGTYTNRDGNFSFKAIPKGYFHILVSYVGYETITTEVMITEGETTAIEVFLRPKPLISKGVVVTANKKVQAVQEVPISISIIEGKLFTERSISTLDQALQYVQGVEVNNDNISIRGSSGFAFGLGSRALLMIDGFPMLSGDNGDIKSDVLPMTLIDQVEIVKGAGSALYGASALGGVINIITREPNEKPFLVANTYYGIFTEPKYDSWKFSKDNQTVYGSNFGYAQKIGTTGISFAGSAVRDESYMKYNDETRYMLFGRANLALSGFTNLIFSGLAATNNRADWVYWKSLDSATRPPSNTDLSNRIRSEKFNFFTELRHIISDKNFLVAKTGIYRTSMENDLTLDEYRQSTATTINSEIQFNSKLHDYFNLTLGINHVYNNVAAEIYGNQEQNTLSLYTQMESPFGDLIFTYGGRLDYEKTSGISNDSVGALEFSPKIGMAYKTQFESTIRASIGHGFRPASVAERFASVKFQGFEVKPNINLKHEKSWSFEVGFNQPFEFFTYPMILDFAFYNNELTDMIEPKIIQGARPYIQFLNTTRARITGIDFNIKTLLFNKIGIETGISAMYPRDLDSNQTLKYRSTFTYLARLIVPIDNFEFFADYRFKSRVEKIDEDLRNQIKDHDARVPIHVLDCGVKYKFGYGIPLDISINVQNILDYYYTEVPGNLGKTRTIILQLGYRL